jgi:hypothetical protein
MSFGVWWLPISTLSKGYLTMEPNHVLTLKITTMADGLESTDIMLCDHVRITQALSAGGWHVQARTNDDSVVFASDYIPEFHLSHDAPPYISRVVVENSNGKTCHYIASKHLGPENLVVSSQVNVKGGTLSGTTRDR